MNTKASIHIEEGKPSYVYHNSRENTTVNSIFSTENNEVTLNGKSALELYTMELSKRISAYTKRIKQKIQKNAITHLSAIVNLEEHHSLSDLNSLKKYLEESLDTIVFQIAIHKDEGHVDIKGKSIINTHAHLEMLGLDSKGYSIRRKLTRKYLSNLQSKNAKYLGMKRGSKKSKRKRLGTYEFKEAMKIANQTNNLLLATQITLENENEELKNNLKITQESEENLVSANEKATNTIASYEKDIKKLLSFIRNTAKSFDCSVSSFDELEELSEIIKESRKTPKIISSLEDPDYNLNDTKHKI